MEYSQNPFAKKPSFEEFLEEEFLLMGDVRSCQKKVALDIFQELVSTNITTNTTNTEQPTLVSFIQPQIQHIQHIEIQQREEIEKIETEIFSVKKKVEEERQIEEQMMIELEKMKSESKRWVWEYGVINLLITHMHKKLYQKPARKTNAGS